LKDNGAQKWLHRQKLERQKKWTEDEHEKVLEALSSLPDALQLESIQSVFRFEKSQDYEKNPASGQDGALGIYDRAFAPGTNLARVLAHELAHQVYRQLSNAETEDYLVSNGWVVVKKSPPPWNVYPLRDGYVEEDGAELESEDFSNNIEYFLFNPEKLKKVTPSAYEWIRKKYGDKFVIAKGRSR
jgi:hypothetical protein